MNRTDSQKKQQHEQVGTESILKMLIDVGQQLSMTIDPDELFEKILNAARKVFRFENAIIRLIDPETKQLVTVASYGYEEDVIVAKILPGEGIMGEVALSGEALLIRDIAKHPTYIPGIVGARCELAVPLRVRDQIIGVFNVESPEPDAFDESQIDLLSTLGNQAAIAIENARLYKSLQTISHQYQDLHQLNDRILHSVNLGIYTVDRNLRILSWNRRMEEVSGVPADVAQGKRLIELFPNLSKEGILERIRQVLESGQAEKLELTHRNLEGKEKIQKRRLAPLKEGNETTGVVVIVEDITDFKRLLDQTTQSEKLAEVGRMSAGIAHEINNPLGIVSYAAELLLREANLTKFQTDMIEQISTETDRLKSLTGSLLSFAKSNETHFRTTDLNCVIIDVLKLLRYELQRNSIQIDDHFSDLPIIQADADKLKQVLINLLMNAAQAIGHDGTISITTMVFNRQIELTISDTGPGIPKEIRDQIFDPFVSSKTDGSGTGLGLYICQNIITEHGGRLSLGYPEKGACFIISLPIIQMTKKQAQPINPD
jgi:PAS domain S-box-containing protein